MKVIYLQANQAWAVVFGDALVGIGSANRRLFCKYSELVWELNACGLRVRGSEVVAGGK